MKELLNTLINLYSNYKGSGKIPVLFLVSLLIMYLFSARKSSIASSDEKANEEADNFIWKFILFIPGCISIAFTYVIDSIRGFKENHNKSLSILFSIIAVFLSVLAIMLSGSRVISKDNYEAAENSLHMKTEYVALLDRVATDVIALEEELSADSEQDSYLVAAPPSISPYISAYTSRLSSLYLYPENSNPSTLNEQQRIVYEQFSRSVPDMYLITRAAKDSGCTYILLDTAKFYPEFKPYEFGFDLVDTVGSYEIYRISREREGAL